MLNRGCHKTSFCPVTQFLGSFLSFVLAYKLPRLYRHTVSEEEMLRKDFPSEADLEKVPRAFMHAPMFYNFVKFTRK